MTVRIQVREKVTGKGIPFVIVRLQSENRLYSDDTDAAGWAEFDNVRDGKYIVKIRSPNHRPFTEKMYISGNSLITDIKLQRAYD